MGTAGSWVVSYWGDKSSTTTAWTAPAGQTVRDQSYGSGGGRVTSLVTDGAGPVGAGTVAGLVARTNAASRGLEAVVVLAPAS